MANPKVSLEEMRARRLAAEAEGAAAQGNQISAESQAIGAQEQVQTQAHNLDQGGTQSQTQTDAIQNGLQSYETSLQAKLTLEGFIASASPEQLAKIREIAFSTGLAPHAASASGHRNADGSMTVSVHLEAPIVEQLELWAEADQCTVAEEAEKRILEALQNYLYGDWSTTLEPAPVPVPVPVAAAGAE
jgi:hypothetical protein